MQFSRANHLGTEGMWGHGGGGYHVYIYIYIYIERERVIGSEEARRARRPGRLHIRANVRSGQRRQSCFSYEEFTRLAETRLAQNSLNYIKLF